MIQEVSESDKRPLPKRPAERGPKRKNESENTLLMILCTDSIRTELVPNRTIVSGSVQFHFRAFLRSIANAEIFRKVEATGSEVTS